MTNQAGLAKSSESASKAPVELSGIQHNSIHQSNIEYFGIPVELYGFFGVDISGATEKQKEKLGIINSLIKSKGETMGDKLTSLKEIERKLTRDPLRSRVDSVYNYLRLSSKIEDLAKQRQALEASSGNW